MPEDETQAFFDAAANGWSRRFIAEESFAMRLDRFRTALAARLGAGAEVLDFGCGSGDITQHLSTAGFSMTGCDISQAMIEAAGRRQDGTAVKWLILPNSQSAPTLPFAPASFDAVVASSVLEYVYGCERVMGEFVRILRPGGWLFATVPDMRHKVRRREQWVRRAATAPLSSFLLGLTPWGSRIRRFAITVNFLSPQSWLEMMHGAGLEVEPVGRPADPLLLLIARRPLEGTAK
jgi:ubiquinone/menaquinone biosynthesis C-methylase UbiE